MTSKEAERLMNEQKSEAESRARSIARRWEVEPDAVAYEMALGKIEHLKGFLTARESVFNAYFVTEEPTHNLVHDYFKRELSQLSRELEYGSIDMPEEADEPFNVIVTPNSVLSCQYTMYEDGTICGVLYRASRIESITAVPTMTVPCSPVLGDSIGIEAVPSHSSA